MTTVQNAGAGSRSRLEAYVPGVTLYVVAVMWVSARSSVKVGFPEKLLQSLGQKQLSAEPIRSLWYNHIQPPGMNAIFAVAYRTRFPILFIQLVQVIAAGVTVLLIVATLLNLGRTVRFSGWCGVIYAALPSTVLYTTYPYNTTLVAFFVTLLMWSFSTLPGRPRLAMSAWCSSVVGLFLIRPSFLWFAVVPMLFVPRWALPPERRLVAVRWASCAAAVVLLVQAHYVVTFRQWTTTSWSGQNVVNALVKSGQTDKADLLAAAGDDACLRSIALQPNTFVGTGSFDPSCFGSRQDLAGKALVLDDPVKASGREPQMNTLDRLEVSREWNRLARKLIQRDPLALVRLALGTTGRPGSFELLMSPSHLFADNVDALGSGSAIMTITRPLGVVFPGAALVLVLVAAGVAIRRRRLRWGDRHIFWVGAGTLAYCMFVGTFLEWSENSRFLTEVYPLLLLTAAVAVGLFPMRTVLEHGNGSRPVPELTTTDDADM